MPTGVTLKDLAQESGLFRSRVIAAYAVIVTLFLILLVRLVQLQVVDYRHFRTLSENNRVKIVPVPPTRGLIYDRNGVILAQNTPTFSLEVVPELVRDIDSTLAGLREVVDITEADERRFKGLLATQRHFENLPIRARLTDQEVARFAVNRHRFPGVDVQARLSRDYPLGALGVHVLGYVGRISEQDLQDSDLANYRGTTHYGKTGVEQTYESVLHGEVGYQHVETNAQGRTLRVLRSDAPTPGDNLFLTIDA